MVSAATPGSPRPAPVAPLGRFAWSLSGPATTTRSGRPAYGNSPSPVRRLESGRSASNSTSAASTDLVDTGASRSPTITREYRSIAMVNSTRTHRSVTGSIANTSSGVESNSRYSPGRHARNRPYTPCGPRAIDRFAFVLPVNAFVPRVNSANTRSARRRPGTTTSAPCSARTRSATR